MSLPFGLLGLLQYRDSTGYDLARTFEDSLNGFWHAQSSQIYRELNHMEQKGWVTSHSVIQNNRPNKRVYSITEDGRNAFNSWMRECGEMCENLHNPLLMRLFFGASAPEVTLKHLKTYRDIYLAGLAADAKKYQTNISQYEAEIPNGKNESLYWRMTLDLGIAHARANAQWAQECIEKLEKEMRV